MFLRLAFSLYDQEFCIVQLYMNLLIFRNLNQPQTWGSECTMSFTDKEKILNTQLIKKEKNSSKSSQICPVLFKF